MVAIKARGFRPNAVVLVIELYTVFFWFTNAITLPYVSTYAGQIGAGGVVSGVVVGAYSIAPILLRFPLGVAADRLRGRKLLLMLGALLFCCSMFGIYLSGSIAALVVCRILQGIAASTWVCVSVLFSSHFSGGETIRAMGRLSVCNSTGNLLGYLVGGVTSAALGVRSVFLVAGVGGLCCLVLSVFVRERGSDKPLPRLGEIVAVTRSKYLLLVSVLAMIGQFVQGSTVWGFTPNLVLALGGSDYAISISSLCYSLPGAFLAAALLPRLIARLGFRRTLVVTMGCSAACCLLLAVQTRLASLYLLCFGQGGFHTLSYTLLMGLAIKDVPEEVRAAAMGFLQSVYSIGLLLGPLIAGAVLQWATLPAVFGVIGALALTAPVLAAALYNRAEAAAQPAGQDHRGA